MDPAFNGVARKAHTTQDYLFTVAHTIMAKGMDMAHTAQVFSTVRTPCMVTVATPVDSEVVSAWEPQVPSVQWDLLLSNLWRQEAEGHQALQAGPARARGPAVPVLPRLPGLKLKQIVSTNNAEGPSGGLLTMQAPCCHAL